MIDDFHAVGYEFLSNFYICPIVREGMGFNSAEAAYQAAKLTAPEHKRLIANEDSPGKAKRMGRSLPIRPDWEDVRLDVMLDVLRLKFGQNLPLAEMLLSTGDALLVEGNRWHDNFWGNCSCGRCSDIPGLNHLGRALMQVREELHV